MAGLFCSHDAVDSVRWLQPVPAFRASQSRLLAEPPLGELQPCDIDVNPLAHHSGSRLSYLSLLSLIATAQGELVGHVADHELIGDRQRDCGNDADGDQPTKF